MKINALLLSQTGSNIYDKSHLLLSNMTLAKTSAKYHYGETKLKGEKKGHPIRHPDLADVP